MRRNILITGASSGLGAEMARQFAAKGHNLVLTARREVAAVRGLPKAVTTYAATKAAVGTLAEGLQLELLGKPIKVSAIFPGYIRSELNEHVANTPFVIDTEVGVRAMVAAIEAEKAKAYVPGWPWAPLARVMRLAPLPLLRRMI